MSAQLAYFRTSHLSETSTKYLPNKTILQNKTISDAEIGKHLPDYHGNYYSKFNLQW